MYLEELSRAMPPRLEEEWKMKQTQDAEETRGAY
jgi:hypothetical protein